MHEWNIVPNFSPFEDDRLMASLAYGGNPQAGLVSRRRLVVAHSADAPRGLEIDSNCLESAPKQIAINNSIRIIIQGTKNGPSCRPGGGGGKGKDVCKSYTGARASQGIHNLHFVVREGARGRGRGETMCWLQNSLAGKPKYQAQPPPVTCYKCTYIHTWPICWKHPLQMIHPVSVQGRSRMPTEQLSTIRHGSSRHKQ